MENVKKLLLEFILPHAREFYRTADTVTGGDRIQRIASWIVTSGVKVVTARDLTRNVTGMRGLGIRDIHARVSPLVAGGWLVPDRPSPVASPPSADATTESRLAMEGNTQKQVCKLPAFNTEKLQSQKRSIH